MKAILVAQYGPPDGLQLQEVETPTPDDQEVLIKIYATTVTSGDVILRKMTGLKRFVFGRFFGLDKDKILGHELAGVVEAVGKDVTRFKPGDQVFASAGSTGGAYAEYICLPEDGMLAIKPANLSYAQAAAVPVGANTALHILRTAKIQSGQTVLIYGASGSVGTYAVQLAKHYGAQVTGVCSTTNLAWVKDLGADQVVDYTQGDFTQSGETYDVVFDAVGKLSSRRGRRALKAKGTYLSVRSPTSEKAEDLVILRELIEAGKIMPVVDRRYPLERAADAHAYVQAGHKRGNVVLLVVREEQAENPGPVHESAEPRADIARCHNGPNVIEIEGIGPAYARKLGAVGIVTTTSLLAVGATSWGREELAQETGISPKLISEWVHIADLMRIKGVGEEYSDLLKEAGVESVGALSNRDPKTLHAKLLQVNAQKRLVRRVPSLNAVESWIALARADGELPDLPQRYDESLQGGARAVKSDHTSRTRNQFTGGELGVTMGALARKLPASIHPRSSLDEIMNKASRPHNRDYVEDPFWVEEILRAAYDLGAGGVSFAEVTPDLVYAGKEAPYRYVIVLAKEMDKDKIASSPSIESGIETAYVTGVLGLLVNRLSDQIEQWGFDAVPAPAIGGPVDYPSLAKLAGMGEFGRHGMLISPANGACQRLAAVFTNLVLPVERSNSHAWVREFCASCGKCIRACPCGAIREESVPTKSGYSSCVETGKCLLYLVTHYGCSVCIKECPFTTVGYDQIKQGFERRFEGAGERQ